MPPPVRAGAAFGLGFRAERDEDESFVAALYASNRAGEVAAFGWPEEMAAAFLDQQHRAQRAHFRRAYPDAEWLIVEQEGRPIGRLATERREAELRLIDIALLPERRGEGLGGSILADLIADAEILGLALSLHVEPGNPALRLYERLGFRTVEERPPYLFMERPAGG